MSTRSKNKIYSKIDLAEAKKSNGKVRKYFARKCEKRETMQIRIDKVWHKKIKNLATSEKMLMSLMLDKICENFFSNYQ